MIGRTEEWPKVKVLLTGPDIRDFKGGVQTHIVNFLDTFNKSSHVELSFFPTTKGLYDQEKWLYKLIRGVYIILPFTYNLLKSDIVHINSTMDNRSIIRDLFFVFLSSIFRNKVLLQFHGGRASEVIWMKIQVLRYVIGKVIMMSHKIIFLSEQQRQDFFSIFPKVSAETVPNYIEMGDRPLKPRNEHPVFLFLARIEESKGIREVIGAAKLLAKRHSFKLIICGNGSLSQWVVTEIADSNLADVVEYKGLVTGKEKTKVLREADVMLLPSYHREGFPYSILEAFKFGMPVIACPIGAIPEIIIEGKNGFLVEECNIYSLSAKMEYFCINKEHLKIMGETSRIMAETRFSTVRMRSEFVQIYTGLR